MSKVKETNESNMDNIYCPNCGTNDVNYNGSTTFFAGIFLALNISLGLLVLGGQGLAAIGFFSLFLTIPLAIIFAFKALTALFRDKKFECNNCGNRFKATEEVEQEEKRTGILLIFVMIGVFIFLFRSFMTGA